MLEDKQVVDLNVEPTPQIDRDPVVEQALQPEQVEENVPAVEQAPAPVVPATNQDVDEFGVPWKNRYMEQKRKNEEVVDRLPQIIEEKLKSVTQPQTPTYTYEQLEVYKQQNQHDPNVVAWTVGEQRKIAQAEQRKLIEEVVGQREQVSKVETLKQKSLEYVQNSYPEAFRRDAQGRPNGWDDSNPITKQIFGLMQDPRLANDPQGLAAAADIAYGRVARSQTPALQQKAQALKAEVKQAQKASLTEGAGRRITTSGTPQQGAIEALRRTGSMRDAESAIGAILRQKGILPE